jgi:hypothetical protein
MNPRHKAFNAIGKALAQGPRAVMNEARKLGELDFGLLVLWANHVKCDDRESGRVLAIECARSGDSGVARACRAWLTAHDTADLGIAHTLLGLFQRDLVESGAWPGFLVGQSLDFFRTALGHSEISVRIEVLSVLAFALRRKVLAHIIHAEATAEFAAALAYALDPIVDDEERSELDSVVAFLHEGDVPPIPAANPRALQRIALDLLDAADIYVGKIDGLEELVEFVRYRALLDDASARVARHHRPLQTLRVKAAEAASRVIQSVIGFGEAVLGAHRHLDFEGLPAPDYGVQVAWAPAASVPIHLTFPDADARTVFQVLERLVEGAVLRSSFEDVVAELPPATAAAFLRLLERLRQHEEVIEVILTDPASPKLQRRVTIGPDTLGRERISSLMKHARLVARGRAVTVPADQVPQANTVRQVFQAVEAIVERGVVTPDDVDDISSTRQVNYYKQGARVLQFLDEDNQPTSRALSIIGIDHPDRLAITAVYFEDTPIGRAWRKWAGVKRLIELDPNSAKDFLVECVEGLSGTTPGRRASTLRRWFQELKPFYPSGHD